MWIDVVRPSGIPGIIGAAPQDSIFCRFSLFIRLDREFRDLEGSNLNALLGIIILRVSYDPAVAHHHDTRGVPISCDAVSRERGKLRCRWIGMPA